MYSKQTPLYFSFWGNSNYPSGEPLQKPIPLQVNFFMRMDGETTAMNLRGVWSSRDIGGCLHGLPSSDPLFKFSSIF